jgi:drug/metabolite transporter (DMT)-like permease
VFNLGFTKDDLKRVAWTALQAFIGAVLVLAPGVFQAPNWETAKTLGVAALVAGVAAAFSAVKNLVLSDGSALK